MMTTAEFLLGALAASIYWLTAILVWRHGRRPQLEAEPITVRLPTPADIPVPGDARPRLLPTPPDLWLSGSRCTVRFFLEVDGHLVGADIFSHSRGPVGKVLKMFLAAAPATAPEMADTAPGQIKIIFPPGTTPAESSSKEGTHAGDQYDPRQ